MHNPYTPAQNQKEYDRKIDAIKKCGENRGPHDYTAMAWVTEAETKHITSFICRVCFTRVSMKTLFEIGFEAKMS